MTGVTDVKTQARQRLARIRRHREDEDAAILAALDAGLSQYEIADRLGRNREWVRQHTPPDRRAFRGTSTRGHTPTSSS